MDYCRVDLGISVKFFKAILLGAGRRLASEKLPLETDASRDPLPCQAQRRAFTGLVHYNTSPEIWMLGIPTFNEVVAV